MSPVTARRALAVLLAAGLAGCGAMEDLGRVFENQAARVRNELEDARRDAEALLADAAAGVDAADAARDRARRALDKGSEILEQAAHRGGHSAESWARLIQDRMMRLEESIRELGRDDRGHADS